MIGKAKTGKGFGGLLRYLESGKDGKQQDRVDWIEARNLPTADPETAAKLMRATANENSRVEKPVYHLSLAWDVKDRPSQAQMLETADRVVQHLGLERHQALYVAHNDGATPHVHIAINRVGPDGRAWNNGHDYRRIEQVLRQVEQAQGWRQVPGRHHQPEGQQRPAERAPSSGQLRQAERTGQAPFAELLKLAGAAETLRQAKTWEELHSKLAADRIYLRKEGRGLVVTDLAEKAKASSLGRDLSLAALEKRLGEYRKYEPTGPSQRPAREPGPDRSGPRSPEPGGDRHAHRGEGGRDPGGPRSDAGAAPRPGPRDLGRAPDVDPAQPGSRGDRRPGQPPDLGRLTAALDQVRAYDAAATRPGGWRQVVDQVRGRPTDIEGVRTRLAELRQEDQAQDRRQARAAELHSRTAQGFAGTYKDPDSARAAFDQAVRRQGIGAATRELERRPESYGAVRGWGLGPLKSQERREALAQASETGRFARMAAAMGRAVEADAPLASRRAEERARLEGQAQAMRERLQTPERRDLLRQVAGAARGLSAEQWRGLSPADRATIGEARQVMRADLGPQPWPGPGRGLDLTR